MEGVLKRDTSASLTGVYSVVKKQPKHRNCLDLIFKAYF